MIRIARLLPALALLALAAPAPGAQIVPGQEAGDETAADDTLAEPIQVTGDRAVLDEDAEETLQALLNRLQGTENVRVRVEAGLARLEGRVPSAEARERAGEVAQRIEGVSFVDNRIELSTSVTDQLGPAVERLRGRLGDLLALLPAMVVAFFAVVLSLLLARWVGGRQRPYALFTQNPFLQNVLRQVVRAVLIFGGILIAVEVLDVTALVGAVVGTAGIAGIALGFAFKDIVENYLAGLLLSLRQPFAPNDTIDLEGVVAKVVRLTARETILMDLHGNHVRVPNATVIRGILTNYSRNPRRRFEVRLTVAPDEDLPAAMEMGLEALRGMEGVLDEPGPTALVEEVGDSWVELVWNGWMDQDRSDFLKVRSEAVRLVLERLDAGGVDMPPPEHRVWIVSEDDSPVGVPKVSKVGGTGDAAAEPGSTRDDRPRRSQQDVSPDRAVDEQIEEDRRSSDEEDLLG